jgi:hypothetical protein
MGLKHWLANRSIRGALKKRYEAMTNDKKATIFGVILAALVASKIDYAALMNGDLSQAGLAVGAVVTAVLGFYVNRKDKPKDD